MLVSPALAEYLRRPYGEDGRGLRLRAALLPGGVAMADSLETLETADLTCPEPLALEENRRRFISMPGAHAELLYLSTSLGKELEPAKRLNMYMRISFSYWDRRTTVR